MLSCLCGSGGDRRCLSWTFHCLLTACPLTFHGLFTAFPLTTRWPAMLSAAVDAALDELLEAEGLECPWCAQVVGGANDCCR